MKAVSATSININIQISRLESGTFLRLKLAKLFASHLLNFLRLQKYYYALLLHWPRMGKGTGTALGRSRWRHTGYFLRRTKNQTKPEDLDLERKDDNGDDSFTPQRYRYHSHYFTRIVIRIDSITLNSEEGKLYELLWLFRVPIRRLFRFRFVYATPCQCHLKRTARKNGSCTTNFATNRTNEEM